MKLYDNSHPYMKFLKVLFPVFREKIFFTMNLNFKRIIDFDKNELSYDILQRCDSDFMYGRFGCKDFESDHPSQNISEFI